VTERLSAATLPMLPADVRRPSYDRGALKAGVVHMGLGAFHRAHQAPIFETFAERGDLRWGIIAASLRSAGVREALLPQDWLYSLAVECDADRTTSVIGALRGVIVAPEDPRRLVEAIASDQTHIVTVTVTEKGYKLDSASGLLLEADPQVRSDLANLSSPATMPGYLAAGLKLRKERGLPPLTIISCDNITANGSKLQASVTHIARTHDSHLAEWIERDCAFPDTMVDRIVPATSAADVKLAESGLGVVDLATVRTEPFSQWVIQNRFAGPRPELECAGVQITTEIAPWEQAKLRLLNGAHSAMAYIGGLAGLDTVDNFVEQPWGCAFVRLLWDELESTLTPPRDLDLAGYRRTLMRRFANPALKHRLRQIAIDGSHKIPQRLVAGAADLLDRGRQPNAIALAIAAWMRWQSGRDDLGQTFDVDDPLASTTQRLVAGAASPSDQARALLSLSSVFPPRLRDDSNFEELVARHLQDLREHGARATVERFLSRQTVASEGKRCG
jgi:fructuronate reductase